MLSLVLDVVWLAGHDSPGRKQFLGIVRQRLGAAVEPDFLSELVQDEVPAPEPAVEPFWWKRG